jgi:flavodoxin
MKGVVVYDSVYGNTKQVGEAIAETIRAMGHQAETVHLKTDKAAPMGDFIFIGSPTQFARMTGKTKRFVKGLDREAWMGKKVVAFETINPLPDDPEKAAKAMKWVENGAGPKLKELADGLGFSTYPSVLSVEVNDMKGPLVDGWMEKTRDFTKEFIASLSG